MRLAVPLKGPHHFALNLCDLDICSQVELFTATDCLTCKLACEITLVSTLSLVDVFFPAYSTSRKVSDTDTKESVVAYFAVRLLVSNTVMLSGSSSTLHRDSGRYTGLGMSNVLHLCRQIPKLHTRLHYHSLRVPSWPI